MAKQKEEKKIISFAEKAAELEKKYAKKKNIELIIPSGSVAYDMAIGGGYHGGRMYEFIAWEGGGKTSMALHAVAETQKLEWIGKKWHYFSQTLEKRDLNMPRIL